VRIHEYQLRNRGYLDFGDRDLSARQVELHMLPIAKYLATYGCAPRKFSKAGGKMSRLT
jgi:hypothetical protein